MKLVKHEGPLPETNKKRKHVAWKSIDDILEEFIAMDTKIAKMEFVYGVDYKNSRSAYETWHRLLKSRKYSVRIVSRNEELYLVKTDM